MYNITTVIQLNCDHNIRTTIIVKNDTRQELFVSLEGNKVTVSDEFDFLFLLYIRINFSVLAKQNINLIKIN